MQLRSWKFGFAALALAISPPLNRTVFNGDGIARCYMLTRPARDVQP
jgi:hypothetical protein